MPDAVVTGSRYRWTEGEGDNVTLREADRGETITVSADELERGEKMGYLKPVGKSDSSSESDALPRTHDELDALAVERGVEWPEGTKTIADKQGVLGGGSSGPVPNENTPGAAPRDELEALSRAQLEERAQGAGITGDLDNSSDEELIVAIQAAGAIAPPPSPPPAG